jgi:hypothetical protein
MISADQQITGKEVAHRQILDAHKPIEHDDEMVMYCIVKADGYAHVIIPSGYEG